MPVTPCHKESRAFGPIVATLYLSLSCVIASDPVNDWIVALGQVGTVRLGDSDKDIANKIKPLWFPMQTSAFLHSRPFTKLVPYTNSAVITEWRSTVDAWGGRPVVLFAVFSDAHKTNLVDALLHDGFDLSPLVEGLYDKNVTSVRAGDSMDRVFTLIGRRSCEYFSVAPGKWRIKVGFPISTGDVKELEVDAGTGKVLKVSVWKKL
jgi:hypothetical protein